MGKKEGSTRPGPVYDDAMKVLAHDDLDAVLSLVGVHGHGAQPLKTELPGSTMHADLVAATADGIVHVEFVKDRDPNLDLRRQAARDAQAARRARGTSVRSTTTGSSASSRHSWSSRRARRCPTFGGRSPPRQRRGMIEPASAKVVGWPGAGSAGGARIEGDRTG